MRNLVRLVVLLLAVPAAVLVGPTASASEPSSRIEPLPARILPCAPNWVQVYHMTGQNRQRWGIRIAGTDLHKTILPAVRGEVDVNIRDADGDENFTVPFDQHSNFSRYVYVSGDNVTINVSVEATPPNGNGCAHVFKIKYS